MKFFEKVRNLPESKRKLILWAVVIIIGLSLLTFWLKNLQQGIKSFKVQEFKEELNLPSLFNESR